MKAFFKELFTLETLIGFGLLLIIVTFNPFVSPSYYIDSTFNYSFVAFHKVTLLAVLNTILLLIWIVKSFKSKQFNITSSKFYYSLLLLIISFITSALLSLNKINSFLGNSGTYTSSVIEFAMLILFFFIFVNNIRTTPSLIKIIRFILISFALVSIWIFIRYGIDPAINSIFLKNYLGEPSFLGGNALFNLIGNYESLKIIFLAVFTLGFLVLIYNEFENSSKFTKIFDSIIFILVGVGLINVLDWTEYKNNIIYIVIFCIILILFLFLMLTNVKLKEVRIYPTIVIILTLIFGFLTYFTLTKKSLDNFSYTSFPSSEAWNASIDSVKSSPKKFIFGVGQGNYIYAIDAFKSQEFTVRNYLDDIRVKHPGSYMVETLSAQGLLGIISILTVVITLLTLAYKKYSSSSLNLHGIMLSLAFIVSSIGLIVNSYDFVILLMFWLTGGLLFVNIYEGVEQKNFNIAIDTKVHDSNSSLSFLLPTLLLILCAPVFIYSSKITSANISAFWAERFANSSVNNMEEYQKSIFDAYKKFDKSDIFVRELVGINGQILLDRLTKLQNAINADPEGAKQNQNLINENLALNNYQSSILAYMDSSVDKFPQDYRNYYLRGVLLSQISEKRNLQLDALALQDFNSSIINNPLHVNSYFQTALIYERNKDYNAAFNSIRQAMNLRSNYVYEIKYADIIVGLKGYDEALQIYEAFKKVVNDNPDNQVLASDYKTLDIENKINNVKKLKENPTDQKNQENPSPSVTPSTTPSKTPTPTVKRTN